MELPDLVKAAFVAEHRSEVVVADVRWGLSTGADRAGFAAGHLPGAVFVDLDRELAGPPASGPGRHPLPHPDEFAAAMGRLGIGVDTAVVAYDAAGGSTAARLWWMLRATGTPAAVLDGGLAAWAGELETGPGAVPAPVHRPALPWPADRVVDADAVEALLADGALVVDARAAERYRGETEPVDARAGHIPGARSAPWQGNLDSEGMFLPPSALVERYGSLGSLDRAVVAYCGSGVTACHDVLALRLAGADARLYEGSWSDWSSTPSRPVATGDV